MKDIKRKGESYIYVVILVIFLSLLLSVLIMYLSIVNSVRTQKAMIEKKVDDYLTLVAIDSYNSVKKDIISIDSIDKANLINGLYDSLGFTNGVDEINYGDFYILKPDVALISDDGLGISLEYNVVYKISWNNKTYSNLEIPIKIIRMFKYKTE